MKSFEKKFNKGINIYFNGDFHDKNVASRKSAYEESLNIIMKDENGYMALMGDLFDSIIAGDRRYDVSTQDDPLDLILEEINKMEERLRPLAEFGKILHAHDGNHEYTLLRMGFGSINNAMAKELGYDYGGWSAITRFIFPKGEFKLFTTHGSGSFSSRNLDVERRMATLKRNLEGKLLHICEADAYVMGHLHRLKGFEAVYESKYFMKNGFMRSKDVLVKPFVGCSGGYVGGYDDKIDDHRVAISYVERALFPPVDVGMLMISIDKFGKIVSCKEIKF